MKFPGSDEWVTAPYRPGDGTFGATAYQRAARWALTLASGRDPGHLYSRNAANGGITFWTRKRISPRTVTVRAAARNARGNPRSGRKPAAARRPRSPRGNPRKKQERVVTRVLGFDAGTAYDACIVEDTRTGKRRATWADGSGIRSKAERARVWAASGLQKYPGDT